MNDEIIEPAPTMAIVLDTETTGFDEPDVIELACTDPFAIEKLFNGEHITCHTMQFKPRKPITWGAMATHHILPSQVETSASWPGSWTVPAGTGYLIGHEVDYDAKAIKLPDTVKRICTLALSRKRWPDLDSHKLVALSYYLASLSEAPFELEAIRRVVKNAHNAGTDVSLTYRVLTSLIEYHKVASWEQLYRLSEAARIPERMDFGKYGPDSDWAKINGGKGMMCAQIRHYDRGYYTWLLNKCDRVTENPYLRKALVG